MWDEHQKTMIQAQFMDAQGDKRKFLKSHPKIKSSKGKHGTNMQPPKKKRK